jgi:uncharacterized protein YsxB (DUF464 family)
MIRVQVKIDDGLIRLLDVRGHARSGNEGNEGVCAAVSVLARSAASTLRQLNDVAVAGRAPGPGELSFTVEYGSAAPVETARGVSEMLLNGLKGVTAENPCYCAVEIST